MAGFEAEFVFPCGEWADHADNGFKSNKTDGAEMGDAELAVAYPRPVQELAEVDVDQPEHDEEDEGEVDDENGVGEQGVPECCVVVVHVIFDYRVNECACEWYVF